MKAKTLHLATALLCVISVVSCKPNAPKTSGVEVTQENYCRAESDRTFANIAKLAGGVNQWFHYRNFVPLDNQTVVRMNKDTLYSGAVVDTSKGATVTMPEIPAGRYASILMVDNDHYCPGVIYEPGTHKLPTDTKYLFLPRFGKVGKQTIKDTGPLTQERMKEFDEAEVIPKATAFMKAAKEKDEPFFVWLNTSRMHLYTRLSEKWRYAAEKYTSEADYYGSGMIQHDHDIGLVLEFLKENGLDENTIIWYSTDNGPEHASWPHGGTTPFRGEKMTCYEGGVRVISMLRWPGVIKPGQTLNGIQGHQDMFTSLAAAAGAPDVAAKMKAEKKQYIDGVNNLPYWKGETAESARNTIFHYYESKLMAVRMGQWKVHFSTKEDYYGNITSRSAPMVFNIRMDPMESYDSKDSYGHLLQKVSWIFAPMGELMGAHLKTLAEYPPVQGGKSFDMSNIVQEFIQKGKQ